MSQTETRAYRLIFALSASLLSLVLLVQNPATIFTGNIEEFSLNTGDYFLVLFAFYMAATLLVSSPLWLFRGLLLKLIASGMFWLAVVAWVYSNFLTVDFGQLDGELFQFDIVDQYAQIELLGLFLSLALVVALAWTKHQLIIYFAMALNLLVGSSAMFGLGANYVGDRDYSEIGAQQVFRLSQQNNILIFVMDQFQSDIFYDLLREDQSIREEMEGFTYFPDTLGVAPTTRLTMPSIHSGRLYEPGVTLSEFYDQTVLSGSILNTLADAGHEVVMVSPQSLGCAEKAAFCEGVWQAMFSYEDLLYRETEQLLNYSLFRAAPLRLKPHIYNSGQWLVPVRRMSGQHFVVVGNKFLNRFSSATFLEDDKPATKLIHLMSTHRPYVLDESCKYTGRNESSEGFRDAMLIQSRCALEAFVGVLRSLKQNNVYDSTAIVLVADTGVGALNVGSSHHAQQEGAVTYAGAALFAAANPVLVVKPKGAREPFSVSDKSVQLTDIPATICAWVEDCAGFPGESVFQNGRIGNERTYSFYYLTQEWSKEGFVPTPTRYRVKGPLWELASWPEEIHPTLRIGSEILFNQDEHNAVYVGEGWGPISAAGTNSYAKEASLYVLTNPPHQSNLEMIVTAQTIAQEHHDGDLVEVVVNGQTVGSWSFAKPRTAIENSVVLPTELLNEKPRLEIRFRVLSETPWVVKRGGVQHIRVSGIRLQSLRFAEVP